MPFSFPSCSLQVYFVGAIIIIISQVYKRWRSSLCHFLRLLRFLLTLQVSGLRSVNKSWLCAYVSHGKCNLQWGEWSLSSHLPTKSQNYWDLWSFQNHGREFGYLSNYIAFISVRSLHHKLEKMRKRKGKREEWREKRIGMKRSTQGRKQTNSARKTEKAEEGRRK